MEDLIQKLKIEIIEALNLQDYSPADIDSDAPLFGSGLGLDSIDSLELMVLLERNYGIKIEDPRKAVRYWKVYVLWLNLFSRKNLKHNI
jgi:acyl carrier protein